MRPAGNEQGWQASEPAKDRWIQTATGRQMHPLDPSPGNVHIEDIAHALAMKCRFTGHCASFYSVAEHSVHLARYVQRGVGTDSEPALWALLHDASEAYLPDVVRPLKDQVRIGGEAFSTIEDRILVAVAERFGLVWPLPTDFEEYLSTLDTRILLTEMDRLMSGDEARETLEGYEPLDVRLHTWTPSWAKDAFLTTFADLQQEATNGQA